MSGLILPNRFTSQPPASTLVDQAKAKELGVVYLAVANESGMLRDVIGGKDIVNPGGSSTGHTGRVWTFSGAQQSNKAITLAVEYNLFVCARIKATAAQAGVPGAAFGVYNSAVQSGFGVGFSGSNQVGLAWLTNGGAGIDAYSTGALNAWYDVYTNLEVTSVGKRAWINGRPATTTQGSSVTNWITGQNEIAVGAQHRSAGFLRNFTGHIEWAAVLILDKAKIDDALSARLYADRFPYNLFKAPARRLWVSAPSGSLEVNASLGTATASGFNASIDRQLLISANLGTATANGFTANVDRQYSITTSIGTATASGFAADISSGDLNITASLGTATASGFTANVDRQNSFTTTLGVASATGLTASIDRQLSVAAQFATATASGFLANIDRQTAIAATTGIATASGFTANISSGDLNILASLGVATASGFTATVSDQDTIYATLGTATASGHTAGISFGGFTIEQLNFLTYWMENNMAIPTPEQIAAAVLLAAQAAPIHSEIKKVAGETVIGSGTEAEPWGPA